MNVRFLRDKYQLYWISILISLALFIPAAFFIPEVNKYKVDLISKEFVPPGDIMIHHNLDSEGNSELIRFIRDFIGYSALLVENEGRIQYQANFTGEFVPGSFYCLGDYDSDGQGEICVFTAQNDSVFLHVIKGMTGERIVEDVFVTSVLRNDGETDYAISYPAMEDLDNDGYKEIVLPFMCGFTKTARKICIYDFVHKQLRVSQFSGTTVYDEVVFFDVDGDGKKEIMGTSSAHDNCDEAYPYSDHFAWLMVLNEDAGFLFEPVKLGSYSSEVKTAPVVEGDKHFLAVFFKHIGKNDDSTFIGIFNAKGELLRKQTVPYESNLRNATLFATHPKNHPEKILLYREDGLIETFNVNLEIIDQKQSVAFDGKLAEDIDLDGDGTKECFLQNISTATVWIARDDFSDPVSVPIPFPVSHAERHISLVDAVRNIFSIQLGENYYTLSYQASWWYPIRYLLYAGLLAGLFGMVYGFGFLFQLLIKRRYEAEKNVAQMQLAAIENQLNPHFNLNILNSIGALYETHEKEKAQYYFGKYNKLLRQSLFQSGQLAVSLRHELEFTLNYLELERLRMNDRFHYEVKGHERLPEVEIPKMLIHTFVENAVKHGLKHLKENGLLLIRFLEGNNGLKIFISDNGIGRERAKQYSSMSTGKGMEIVNKSLLLFFQIQNTRIEYKITDLYKEAGEAAGTEVEITVPLI